MVSPAPDAWLQHVIVRSFERRLCLPTVSVAGQPDFKARDNSAEISSTPELVSPETTHRRQSPPVRGLLAQSGKFPSSRECVVEDAVQVEPVSASNSLIPGTIQGIAAPLAESGPTSASVRAEESNACCKNSLLEKTGNFPEGTGKAKQQAGCSNAEMTPSCYDGRSRLHTAPGWSSLLAGT
jgi:hypothetical protein